MGKEFILSGIHIIAGRRVRRRRNGEWQQTRQRYDKSPTSKIYATWARILSDRNVFCTLTEGRKTAGSNALGAFLVFSTSLPPDFRFSLGQINARRKLPLNISIIFGRSIGQNSY